MNEVKCQNESPLPIRHATAEKLLMDLFFIDNTHPPRVVEMTTLTNPTVLRVAANNRESIFAPQEQIYLELHSF